MIYNQINIHSLISANIFGIKKQYQNMSRESQCAPSHESHWCFFQATFVIIIYKINYCYHYMFYFLTSDLEALANYVIVLLTENDFATILCWGRCHELRKNI